MTGHLAQLPSATLDAFSSLTDVEQKPEEVSSWVCYFVRHVRDQCFLNWAGFGGMNEGTVLHTGIECV